MGLRTSEGGQWCRVIPLMDLLGMIYPFIQKYLSALPGTVPVLCLKPSDSENPYCNMKPCFLANFNVFIRLRGTSWKVFCSNSRMDVILSQHHQALLRAVACVTTWPSTPPPTHPRLTMVPGAQDHVLCVIVFLTPHGSWAG